MTTAEQQQRIKDAIDVLAEADGTITPEQVVTAASDPDSPLHGQFEWDDATAAHQQRLAIARALIRSVRYISADSTDRIIRQIKYVHDPRTRSQAYIGLRSVAKNKQLARDVMLEELARCMSAIERAREVAAILNLDCELEQMVTAIANIQAELTRPARKSVSRAPSSRDRTAGRLRA